MCNINMDMSHGQQVRDTKHGRRSTRITLKGGLCNNKHIVIEQYEHTTTAAFFDHWFSECLVKNVPGGCTIIMDDVSFYRKNALLELIEETK